MKTRTQRLGLQILLTVLATFSDVLVARAAVVVKALHVEYRTTPMGIDVEQPRFGWQMAATAGERGARQTAYRILVRDPRGNVAWDTGRLESAVSLGIAYAGSPLRAATRYRFTVTVWDQTAATATATSWFETGLMNPAPGGGAWSNAEWIGGGDQDLVLYSPYLTIFDLGYALTIAQGSTRASFVYGANDPRLMEKSKNIYQVASGKDQSFIKLELDIAAVDGADNGKARLNVYRAGYKDSDTPSRPFQSFDVSTDIVNNANKHGKHVFQLSSAFGRLNISIDGKTEITGAPPRTAINLNPVGAGGNYIPFGMLCDMGFSVDAGQSASFGDLVVSNTRFPNHVLFREDLSGAGYKGIYADFAADPTSGLSVRDGRYVLTGGTKGVFVVRNPSRNSMPVLRTVFKTAAKKIAGARLYVTARGIYEIFLNGRRVGDDHYNPGLTQYNITHLYQTYDVTDLVHAGDNALGAMLGEGWWSGLLSFGSIWNHFGDRQSLLGKLVVSYEDGSSDVVTTNSRTWKYYTDGPLVYSSLDLGEIYDATKDAATLGWSTAAYDDRRWKSAVAVPLEGTTYAGSSTARDGTVTQFDFAKLSLIGQIGNNAGVFKVLTAESVKEVRKGVYVYHMGQNIVGVPRVSIRSGHAGGKLTLRYSEVLYPDLKESGPNVGMIMTENYRAALSQDIYTMKSGSQVFQPRFTSHGYQYIEITGVDAPLPLKAVEGLAMSSVRELTADYKTSSAKVNKLWSNLVWSNIDNFLTLPTDCPQRNERMGWSGDISVFSHTATYVSNADQFLTRHMYAMRDVQAASGRFTDIAPIGGGFGGVLWGSAGIVVPWEVYQQYDDVGLLRRHYPAMVAYIDYLETTLDPKTDLSSDGQLGDWLGPQNNQLGTAFLATAYHAYDLGIMARVAAVLGHAADAEKYRDMYERRKAFFNATFVNPEKRTLALVGGQRRPGERTTTPAELKLADTQTSYAVPLAMGLFSDENIPHMVEHLPEAIERENKDDGGVSRPKYSLMTGFIGTAWISKALSEHGQSALAYRILQNNQYPSWLYAIDQGATSIWERLNGYTVENGFGGNNSMNSFNHYSFGAVGQWMMAHSLGIQRDQPGFKRFILQPEPDPTGGITFAEGHYDSMYGRITSAWAIQDGVLTYKATVPANTTATAYVPAVSKEAVKEGGKEASRAAGVTFVKYENGKAVYRLEAGSYEFSSRL